MTHQCMQCGSPTRAGAKFCHQCGTPIATSSLPPTMPFPAPPTASETRPQAFESASRTAAATEAMPTPTAYMSQMPQTYQPPMPMPQPPQKSRGGFKIVMITLAIIFALGIASVIGAAFFIRSKVEQARRNFPSLPTISDAPDSVPDDRLGAPMYPGAKRTKTVSGGFGKFNGAVVEFTTSDSVDKVADFYREYFQGKEQYQVREVSSDDEPSVVFTVGNNTGTRVITITEDDKNSRLTKIVMVGGNIMAPPRGGAPVPPPEMAPPPPPPPGAPPPPEYAPPRR